jgi:hypothetical protein
MRAPRGVQWEMAAASRAVSAGLPVRAAMAGRRSWVIRDCLAAS